MEDKPKEYDMIEFPIHRDLLGKVDFTKKGDTYTTFIEDCNVKKKIVATKKEHLALLFEINEEVKLVGVSKEAYSFDTPVDLVVPVTDNVKEYYQKIEEVIMKGDPEELVDLSNFLTNNSLPFYPPPVLLSNPQSDINILKDKKQDLKVKVKYVPNENDYLAEDFLKTIFEIHPILRAEFIIKNFEKEFKEKDKVTANRLKVFLPNYAFFLKTGPFSKCWVKNGLDVKSDSLLWIYQVFGKTKSHEKLFQLFENPYLVNKVEKNRSLYFSGVYDEKRGYLTNAALLELENESESEEEGFDVYD